MAVSFYEQPVLNSPYAEPKRHHALDSDGRPLDAAPVMGRRRSELLTPIPKPRTRRGRAAPAQADLDFDGEGAAARQQSRPNVLINEIRAAIAE